MTILLGCNEQCKNAWVYYMGRLKLCSNTAIINDRRYDMQLIFWTSLFSELSRSDHPRAYRYTHFINCNLFHFQVSSINYTTTTNSPPTPPLLYLLITLLQCVRASSVAIIKFRFVRNFLDELCARVVWKWFPIKLCWVGDNRCLKRLVKSNNYWPSPMWH